MRDLEGRNAQSKFALHASCENADIKDDALSPHQVNSVLVSLSDAK